MTSDVVAGNDSLIHSSNNFHLVHTTSEIVEMAYQMIFFLFGTPINIFAFWRQYQMQRNKIETESRLIKLSLHLIVANLWVLCIYCVWRTYWFMNIVWTDGDFMCRVYSVATTFPFHLWSNMVAAIAFDMLCCITSPLASYRTGSNRVNWLIASAWIAAFLCSLPMAIFRGSIALPVDNSTEQVLYQCYPNVNYFSETLLTGFNIFHVITSFYVPLLIVVVCYTIIGASLRRQMKERRLLTQTINGKSSACLMNKCVARVSISSMGQSLVISRGESTNRLTPKIPMIKLDNCPSPPVSYPESRRGSTMSTTLGEGTTFGDRRSSCGSLVRRFSDVRFPHKRTPDQPSRTKNRFLRVTIAIIATFVLTWLPYQVFALLRVLCSEDTPCSRVAERLNWLQAAIIASACINPFLYRFRTRPVSSGSAINTTADRMSSYKDIKESHSSYQLRNRLAIDECRPKRGDSSMNLTALRIADESSLLGTHGDLPKRATSALALSTLSPANKDTSDDCHNV